MAIIQHLNDHRNAIFARRIDLQPWPAKSMGETHQFAVRYWGVTGSYARVLAPDEVMGKIVRSIGWLHQNRQLADLPHDLSDREFADAVRSRLPDSLWKTYGGNTTCIEISTSDTTFLVDAGTGLQSWGVHWDQQHRATPRASRRPIHLMLTHAHLDHTCALPFVDAFYDANTPLTLWANRTVLDQIQNLMTSDAPRRKSLLPTTLDMLKGIRELRELPVNESIQIKGTQIHAHALCHPGECLAFRFRQGGRSVVVATDHEHPAAPDVGLAQFAEGCDLLYLDAQYRRSEYEGSVGIGDMPAQSRRGWGHSCIECCIETALAADVRRLHLGHHDPRRDDADLATLERYAKDLVLSRGREPLLQVQLAAEGDELML